MNSNNPLSQAISSRLSQEEETRGDLALQKSLEEATCRIEEARWKEQRVFICGNGGSASTANHFAADLHKTAMTPGKPPIDSESLCANLSEFSAWANDSSYENVFVGMMEGKVKKGHVLIVISGSGNSQNVLNAVSKAKTVGATTIGFTGFNGGKLKDMVDICAIVPSNDMKRIEDIHVCFCHLITDCLERLSAEEILGLKPRVSG